MVGEDIEYVVVEAPVPGTDTTARYLIAESRLAAYARDLAPADGEGEPQVVGRYRGADLVGRTYTPPFGYYLGHERAFRAGAGRVRHDDRRHRAGAHRRRLR